MDYKIRKTMIDGKYLKVNGKHIKSIGYFAFDGCHKINILQSESDLEVAMSCGYYLYPIETIKRTYEDSKCCLKYIGLLCGKYLVNQFEKAKWSEVKAPQKDIDKIRDRILGKI